MPCAMALGKPSGLAVRACTWMGFQSPDTAAYARPVPSPRRHSGPAVTADSASVDGGSDGAASACSRAACEVGAHPTPHHLGAHAHLGHEVDLPPAAVRPQVLRPHGDVERLADVDGADDLDPVLDVHGAEQRRAGNGRRS